VLAALISLAVVVILLVVLYVRDRGNRASSEEVQISLNPQKFDTTLGDFHDMREALRPPGTRSGRLPPRPQRRPVGLPGAARQQSKM
jgi:hypothetical protein